MRLFAYYALHSFKNQLRKLFKSWVLIFIVACMVIGGGIGYGAARLSELSEEQEPVTQEEIGPEITDTELPWEDMEEEGMPEETRRGLIELIAGAVILAIFCIEIFGADKNGSRIFLPADVNLLFPSPMKPQSVLMFRLATQMGVALFASVYMLFQLPNLVLNAGMTLRGGLAMILAWGLTLLTGKLIQVLLYTVCSTKPSLKPYIRRGLYALLIALAAAFFALWKGSGLSPLEAAFRLFNQPWTRWIPFWGWIKGTCIYGETGSPLFFVCLALVLLGSGVMIWGIWRIKADFYEDAMAKSEETAALLEKAQNDKSSGLVVRRRKKDRSDSLRRDGLNRGQGANVFFYKSLYNRFRFAHFGFLTKTLEFYLLIAAFVALLLRYVFDVRSILPVGIALTAAVFFRALGNPLEQDTQMDYFLLIPESTRSKLFWSLMGGTANCLLDVLPAMILGAVLVGKDFLLALALVPFIVSMDFYATTVGAFIGVSVPVNAGKMIKQFVQIMFIYFGLIPDVAVIATGMVLGFPVQALAIATGINLVLGLLFLCLTPRFLDPKGGKSMSEKEYRAMQNAAPEDAQDDLPLTDLKPAKKQFSRLGLGVFVILVVTFAVSMLAAGLIQHFRPELMQNQIVFWALNFAPLYLVGAPVGYLLLRTVPKEPLAGEKMSLSQWIKAALISFFLMYAGNLIGVQVLNYLNNLFGLEAVNPLDALIGVSDLWLQILVTVILGPIVEELIFRRALISRMHPYGEKLAV
ncbi:MAG: putative ABC exporter domain-containing protein, partial [Oscillospiraceae bacterium]|nr:putative ABC exporter domain-containing protein [Oscillospiraceae bacterium]